MVLVDLWRLPVVFACPIHRRLLEHRCPVCRQPPLWRGSRSAMVPRGADNTLQPTACRASIHPTAGNQPTRACGQRLDQTPDTTRPRDLAALLALQDRLLALLHA